MESLKEKRVALVTGAASGLGNNEALPHTDTTNRTVMLFKEGNASPCDTVCCQVVALCCLRL